MTPLLSSADGMAESEGIMMTSHSKAVDDDMLTLQVRLSGDGRTFSVPTKESSRFDEKSSILHQLSKLYIEICLGVLILISSFPACYS